MQDLYVSDSAWNIVILRYFNPIGAHESGIIGEDPKGIPNNLMPYISQVAVGKREYLGVFGDDYETPDGTGVRDYIHAFEKACNKEIPYKIMPRRAGDIAVYYCDPSKAYRELGWKAEKTLEDMCADSWMWQSNNPDGYKD